VEVGDVDIANYQMVATDGDTIGVIMPKGEMTKDEALVHAAWLSVLADPLGERFEAIKQRVMST